MHSELIFCIHLFSLLAYFYYYCLFKFNFFHSLYFYSTPSSIAYKLGIYQHKYKQSPCGLDTWSSVLIFTTCDKIGTLANQLIRHIKIKSNVFNTLIIITSTFFLLLRKIRPCSKNYYISQNSSSKYLISWRLRFKNYLLNRNNFISFKVDSY